MQLRAASALAICAKGAAAAPAQETLQQEPAQAQPAGGGGGEPQKLRGAFGRLTPVHPAMHQKLTKGGYKHDANYVTQSGQGQFGYYSNPASGHKVVMDDRGNVQDQQPMPQAKGGGNKMQFGKK